MWGRAGSYPTISSYAAAVQQFNAIKDLRGTPGFKPLDQRTRHAKTNIRNEGDSYIIQMYQTDIVKYYPNGDVWLNHGGWITVSTAEAISALSPLSAWCKYGDMVIRCGQHKFVLSRAGLLFKQTLKGLIPENPPVAVQRKKRVRKTAAKEVREFFKGVPPLIRAYSAAFEGGEVHQKIKLLRFTGPAPLTEAEATDIAMANLYTEWDFQTGRRYKNKPKVAIESFWRDMYKKFNVIETYEIPLGYGEVAK